MNETITAILMLLGLIACVILVCSIGIFLFDFIIRRIDKKQYKTVHCNTCVWYEVERTGECEYRCFCTHRSNTIIKKNWQHKKDVYIKSPRRLNKRMDCENYESNNS